MDNWKKRVWWLVGEAAGVDVPCSFVPQMPVDDVPTEARCLIFGDVPDIQIWWWDGVGGGGRLGGGRGRGRDG